MILETHKQNNEFQYFACNLLVMGDDSGGGLRISKGGSNMNLVGLVQLQTIF